MSGLEESRHTGSQRARIVAGVAVHEQLVWRTSRAPLMVTVVLEPSFDCPCAVASSVKPFSLAFVRTSPLLRLGRLYVVVTALFEVPVTTTVVGPLMDGPVYLSVTAIAPPVHPLVVVGGGVAHAVLETHSEQIGQPGQVAWPVAVICLEVPGTSQVAVALLHESLWGQVNRFPGLVTVCPARSVATVIG